MGSVNETATKQNPDGNVLATNYSNAENDMLIIMKVTTEWFSEIW